MPLHAFYRTLSIEADFPDGMVTWTPFIGNDGRVGYHVQRLDNVEPTSVFLYLLPSSEGDEGAANVFLYIGTENEPGEDAPVHWYEPFDRAESEVEGTTRPG